VGTAGYASSPTYSPSGHLLFDDESGIWALPFSLSTLTVTGDPFVVAAGVFPDVSADGTLTYLPQIRGADPTGQLVWVDRTGSVVAAVGEPLDRLADPAIAEDGVRIAVSGFENGDPGVWVYDVDRGVLTQLSSWEGGVTDGLAWSPRQDEIFFGRGDSGRFFNDLMTVAANGSGEPRLLVSGDGQSMPHSPHVSSDGRFLLYAQGEQDASQSLWMLPLTDADGVAAAQTQEPQPFLSPTEYNRTIVLSPNSRYAAFVSGGPPSERDIFLTEFPSGNGRVKVSIDGGHSPRWSRDGAELFYVVDDRLMAVTIATGTTLDVGTPAELFRLDDTLVAGQYDVAADGTRFLMVERLDDAGSAAIAVVQNWFAEFEDERQ